MKLRDLSLRARLAARSRRAATAAGGGFRRGIGRGSTDRLPPALLINSESPPESPIVIVDPIAVAKSDGLKAIGPTTACLRLPVGLCTKTAGPWPFSSHVIAPPPSGRTTPTDVSRR